MGVLSHFQQVVQRWANERCLPELLGGGCFTTAYQYPYDRYERATAVYLATTAKDKEVMRRARERAPLQARKHLPMFEPLKGLRVRGWRFYQTDEVKPLDMVDVEESPEYRKVIRQGDRVIACTLDSNVRRFIGNKGTHHCLTAPGYTGAMVPETVVTALDVVAREADKMYKGHAMFDIRQENLAADGHDTLVLLDPIMDGRDDPPDFRARRKVWRR
jgi:hypothetical protein